MIAYHKREGPWRQGSVVVDAVPHTDLDLRLLDPVASGVVEQTHDSVGGDINGDNERLKGQGDDAVVLVNVLKFPD